MSNSWVPPKGKRSVVAGSSLTRALNARRSGGAASTKKPLHLRDFYSFRYNFRPPSVDAGERGRVVVGGNTVTVERPSTQSSEAHRWTGTQTPAKEWDCVLIYDEVSETYTLEKLDSVLTLTHQPRTGPIEPPAPVESLTKRALTYDEELERELLAAADGDEDADGERDDEFEQLVPKALKEEEEEGEVFPSPPPPPIKKAVRVKQAPVPALERSPVKPDPAIPPATPVIKVSPASQPVPVPTAKARPVGKKHKREPEPVAPVPVPVSVPVHHLSDADEEVLQFGKPAKRARPSPPRSRGLALPGASTAAFIPPAPVPDPVPPVAPPEPIQVGSESEEDEEWDEVAAVGKTVDTEDDFDIFGDAAAAADDGEDIGMDELERELNLQMDEDEEDEEDFLTAVVEEAPPSRGPPMSLKELAGGVSYASDDDYSSSEESDED